VSELKKVPASQGWAAIDTVCTVGIEMLMLAALKLRSMRSEELCSVAVSKVAKLLPLLMASTREELLDPAGTTAENETVTEVCSR